VLVKMKWGSVFDSQNSLGSSFTLLQNKDFPCAPGVKPALLWFFHVLSWKSKDVVVSAAMFLIYAQEEKSPIK
jgi:hypothetical protein